MFCKSQRVQLQNTHLEDGTIIVWKEFEQSFTMIGIGKGYTEKILRDLLELVFNATIFTIGLNEVKHNKNAEKIKRELKVRPALIPYIRSGCEIIKFLNFAELLSDRR